MLLYKLLTFWKNEKNLFLKSVLVFLFKYKMR